MRPRMRTAPPQDDDALLRQARRLIAAVNRLRRLQDGAGPSGASGDPQRRTAVSLLSDLNDVLPGLRHQRDALGVRAGIIVQSVGAASAYSRVGGLLRRRASGH